MKLKLLDVINSKDVLEKINKEAFSAKVSYFIQRNLKNINNEFLNFSDTRLKLFEKYGEKIEESYRILPEKIEKFTKEMNELITQEIELDIIQVSLDEFDCKLSPEEMSKIDWMFKFEQEV